MQELNQLMTLITVVVLAITAFSIMTMMTTNVIERRKEIGIMKAIGANSHQILKLFIIDSILLGLFGGIFGYFVGFGLANIIAQQVFTISISLIPNVLFFSLGISFGIALLGSIIPVRKALQIDPAIVIRGD